MTLSKVIHTLTDDDIMQASLKARRAEFLCNAARIRHERERLPVVDFTSIHLSIGNLERMIYGEMPDPTDEQLAQERELEADAEWLDADARLDTSNDDYRGSLQDAGYGDFGPM